MARALSLTESQVIVLANKWLEADTEGKKQLLIEYRISKPTLYRSMRRYGFEFVKNIG